MTPGDEVAAVLLIATALYLGYHYGAIALVERAGGAPRGVHQQRVLGFVLLGLIPAALAELFLPGGLRAHGLGLAALQPGAAFLALVVLVVLPVVTLAARSPRQWAHYPQIRRARWDRRAHLENALSWSLYLLGYELFFRGVLTFVLARDIGYAPGLAVMTALYVAVHLPKPAGEAIGTLPMGLLFGVTALASGGIWAAWLGHCLIAITSDVASATFAGRSSAAGAELARPPLGQPDRERGR